MTVVRTIKCSHLSNALYTNFSYLGSRGAVEILLRKGANLNFVNRHGFSALDYASNATEGDFFCITKSLLYRFTSFSARSLYLISKAVKKLGVC